MPCDDFLTAIVLKFRGFESFLFFADILLEKNSYIDFLFLKVYWNRVSACGLLLVSAVVWCYCVCDSVRTAW